MKRPRSRAIAKASGYIRFGKGSRMYLKRMDDCPNYSAKWLADFRNSAIRSQRKFNAKEDE